jgi:hypothetical protein
MDGAHEACNRARLGTVGVDEVGLQPPHEPIQLTQRPAIRGRGHGPLQGERDVGAILGTGLRPARTAQDHVVAGRVQAAGEIGDVASDAALDGLMDQEDPSHRRQCPRSAPRTRRVIVRAARSGGRRSSGS